MKKLLIVLFILAVTIPLYAVKSVFIYTRSLPNGQNGVAYSSKVFAKFGTKPYTFTVNSGSLPTGLSLASTGAITGTPSANGTFNFVIRVTDNGAVTNDKSFSIVIAGTAVVTAVKIDTTTLPAGQVSVAYSTSFTGSGGTAPYTFSKVSGTFPAGLALVSPTLSGTPTAPGTYPFIIRVTDAGSQTYDRAFSIEIASGGTYLFSDGFEAGCAVASCQGATSVESLPYFPAWSAVGCGSGGLCPKVQNTTKRTGTYAYEQRYTISSSSGASHQDLNRWLKKSVTPTNHGFLRGYLYLKSPEAGGTKNGVQRKIFWLAPNNDEYSFGLTLDASSDTNFLRFFVNGSTACSLSASSITFGSSTLWDGWHSVELDVQLNDAGSSNGIVKVYVDGVQVGSTTSNRNIRGNCTSNIEYFSVGRQTDRLNYNAVDEYRYWDDVVWNDSLIGP